MLFTLNHSYVRNVSFFPISGQNLAWRPKNLKSSDNFRQENVGSARCSGGGSIHPFLSLFLKVCYRLSGENDEKIDRQK